MEWIHCIAALKAYTYIHNSLDKFTEVITIVITNYFTQLDNNTSGDENHQCGASLCESQDLFESMALV